MRAACVVLAALAAARDHQCGVLFVASGTDAAAARRYLRSSIPFVEHLAVMRAPAGWCREEPDLDRYPVVMATDADAENVFSKNVKILALGSVRRPLHGLLAVLPNSNQTHAWKWWRPALFSSDAVPFPRTLSLDFDVKDQCPPLTPVDNPSGLIPSTGVER